MFEKYSENIISFSKWDTRFITKGNFGNKFEGFLYCMSIRKNLIKIGITKHPFERLRTYKPVSNIYVTNLITNFDYLEIKVLAILRKRFKLLDGMKEYVHCNLDEALSIIKNSISNDPLIEKVDDFKFNIPNNYCDRLALIRKLEVRNEP